MIALVLVACDGEAPTGGESALDPSAFRFCHEPGAAGGEARDWCELLEGVPEDRCPGLRETCATDVEEARGCASAFTGSGPGDDLAGGPRKPREPFRCQDVDLDWMAGLLRWVAAIAVAVGVLLLFRVLWATFGRGRGREVPEGVPVAAAVEDEALPDVPDLPSGDLLAAARGALADGRFGEAVLLARGAALRHLGEVGRLRLHRSRTDREYVREVRRDEPVATDLRAVVAATEDHRFGGRGLESGRAEAAVRAAERLLVVGAVLVALLPATAHGQSDARHRPSGDAALVRLFELHGYEAGYRLSSLLDLDDGDDVLVLDLSGVTPTGEQWEHLREWVFEGAVLVVGGDATVGFEELGVYVDLEPGGRPVGRSPLLEAGLPVPRWPGGPSAGFEEGAGRVLVGVGERGDEVAAVEVLDVGVGVVVAIADPRLLWNGALVDPDNEVFLGDLAYTGQSMEGWPIPTPARLQLATLSATSAPQSGSGANPFRSLANARLLPFVLQLMLLWVLLALWRGLAFGPLTDPKDEGRIDFVEHVQALGTRYARLRASGHAARAMAALWLARLGPAGLQWAAERAGLPPDRARAWTAEVEARAAGDGHPDPADHEWMEELWRITRRSS